MERWNTWNSWPVALTVVVAVALAAEAKLGQATVEA